MPIPVVGPIAPVYNPQNWMLGFSFSDVFKEGATAGIAIGQHFIESKVGLATQTNVEFFYNFPVTSNIRITPDVQVIFNPNNNLIGQVSQLIGGPSNPNGTIFVGTLRTYSHFNFSQNRGGNALSVFAFIFKIVKYFLSRPDG